MYQWHWINYRVLEAILFTPITCGKAGISWNYVKPFACGQEETRLIHLRKQIMSLASGKHLTSYSTPNKGSQNSLGVSIVMIHRMFPWNVQRYKQWMKRGNSWHNIASVLTVLVAVMKPQIATADLHAVHANADIILQFVTERGHSKN